MVFAVAVWARLRTYTESTNDVLPETEIAAGASSTRDAKVNPSAEPYTMVATDSDGNPLPRGAETSAQRSAREQRYNELLHSAPPAARPADAPSFLDRMVSPIANALGMNRPKPAQPAAPRQQPQQQRPNDGQPRNASNNGNGNGTGSDENPRSADEDDPDTDVTPPQLLTADFNPPEVQDGEETVFSVTVNDNRSGVRSVSGVVTNPTGGSMQGFSCTREGETNRFVARVMVPKDAAEGIWVVRYLTLSDNASNTISLNQSQGGLPASASFKVVSPDSDSTGPQLKRVWLQNPVMRAGERNTVFVQAEDDKAGVSLVSGVFVSPSHSARIGFGCGDKDGTWECTVQPPTCLDCGTWTLEQIQLQDKANNMTTFRGADNQIVRGITLDISGDVCDASPPEVTSLVLSPTVISNSRPSIIKVRATLFDKGGCGNSSLSAQAIPPGAIGNQRNPVRFTLMPDGETFEGELEIPQFAAKGQWSFAWVQALDKGLNLRAYSSADDVVARATFRVE